MNKSSPNTEHNTTSTSSNTTPEHEHLHFEHRTPNTAAFGGGGVGGDGGGDDGGDGGDGKISPEHPIPILHAPRDIISRKGKSLTPIYIYIYQKSNSIASKYEGADKQT